LKWCSNEENERATTRDLQLKKAKSATPTPPIPAPELTPPPTKRQRVDDFLDFMSDDDNNVPTVTTTAALAEINDYLSQLCTN